MKSIVVAMALGMLCGALGGCVSDSGTPLTKIKRPAGDGSPLRYYGGPKSPMWADR